MIATSKMVQEYDNYTEEDHRVWSLLYAAQMKHLPAIATDAYLKGIEKVQFVPDRVPRFSVINAELEPTTGWTVYVVPGLIDNKPFFEHLARREFPATTWLRKLSQIDYIEEPDMFHDVFGHVPLLSEHFFCNYLKGLSDIALAHIEDPTAVELIARMYWFTVEFGLIQERGELKIYGAGILSSPGESVFSVSEKATHVPFDIDTILDTPYIKDRFQDKYFVVDSYEQLFNALPVIREAIESILAQGIVVEPS